MKVTGQQPHRTPELAAGKSREAEFKDRVREGGPESATQTGNRTSLTMNKIKEAIRNTPDVRANRVAQVREKIMSGEYKVDAERLAGNMLTESLRDDLERP